MKTFTLSALALLTAMVSAAPAPAAQSSPPDQITITFIGAADGKFTQTFTTDGFSQVINNPLSVSKISNPGGAICDFVDRNGKNTFVPSGETVDVGPPRQLEYGFCFAS